MMLLPVMVQVALAHNVVLERFWAAPYLDDQPFKQTWHSFWMPLVVVTLASTIVVWGLNQLIIRPFQLDYLAIPIAVAVVMFTLWGLAYRLKSLFPTMAKSLVDHATVMMTHSLPLGVALLTIQNGSSLSEAIGSALGAGLGLWLVMTVMASLKVRLDAAPISPYFKGLPILLVTCSILSAALCVF